MNMDERMEKLCRAADWRAALTILRDAFGGDGRVWQHVDLDREEIHFKTMLKDGTFSSGERALLKIAASLFNPEHSLNMWEVFNRLDETNTALVLRAIESFCRA